jgi:hypothetical protein
MRENKRRNVVIVSNGIANLQNGIMKYKSANSRQLFFTPSLVGNTGHCSKVSGVKNAGNSPITFAKDSPKWGSCKYNHTVV